MRHRVSFPASATACLALACAPPLGEGLDGPPEQPLRLTFYDVGQGLSVLVELPDRRRILVDTGDSPDRPNCGEPCATAHAHLMNRLASDLGGDPLDLVWLTHAHSDHVGGAAPVFEAFGALHLVDNGRDLGEFSVRRVRAAAAGSGTSVTVVEPGSSELPVASTGDVLLTAIAPPDWPLTCEADPNDCSIWLRIDYRESSVLFTGDAGSAEEAATDPLGPVSLLQVAHHGSESSSSSAFLAAVRPRYAVISAGEPGSGPNAGYCHPRAATVRALTEALGPGPTLPLLAFDGPGGCPGDTGADWVAVPASDRLWATERDGDVVLSTRGDGRFERESTPGNRRR